MLKLMRNLLAEKELIRDGAGPRKTAILGFLLTLQSIKDLAEDLVWSSSPLLKCLLTRKLSQDHLELFFATIRNRTGNNNNPRALEIRSAHRKCLIGNVLPSSRGNCQVDGTQTLLFSSSDKRQQDPSADTNQDDADATWVIGYKPLSEFAESIVQYIAGNVAVNFAKDAKCPDCARIALLTTDKCDLVRVKDKGGLHSPSPDILHLCTTAEKVLRRNFDTVAKGGRNWLLRLQTETLSIVSLSPSFKRFDHLFVAQTIDNQSHFSVMLKKMLAHYFQLRIHHMCRQQSAEERKVPVRQYFNKLVLFHGQ
ncbi:uncharacterized protein LOC120847744 [Ixodes scapularis]|uniref:uncharacterized protein LOC120847744 n=1 Tax=Ixodes scapularis TaxID=6945 RepID=UPI001A9DA3E4|nr:uncharacterized protein LOC120847744 [Ixodes scapularis]